MVANFNLNISIPELGFYGILDPRCGIQIFKPKRTNENCVPSKFVNIQMSIKYVHLRLECLKIQIFCPKVQISTPKMP